MNIIEAIDDPNLFRPWYQRGEWANWRAFLKALFALEPTADDLSTYQRLTKRTTWPSEPFREVWMPIGRRGGKSLNLAVIGTYLAAFHEYRDYVQPGERATVAILAADRAQSRVILRYIQALMHQIPMLEHMIQRETAQGIDLRNQTTIEVTTASSRTSRGYTFAAVLCDEIAFWNTDEGGNDPDSAILNAMRPGMATIPGSMLLCASSPYARRGQLWDNYDRHFGVDDSDVLVWQAPSWVMNPTIPESFINREYEKDPESAKAEFGGEFRTDVEAFVSIEVLRACTEEGVFERSPEQGKRYMAFVDPSGGSADSFTLCIVHPEEGQVVVDAIREVKPPFSPESVVGEFVQFIKTYGIGQVTGDRYAGEWPREQFRKLGIRYNLSPAPRTDLYLALLPALNSKRASLLEHDKLQKQLLDLERRTSRAGKDIIDHPRNGHDDVANAVAGAVYLALKPAFEPPRAAFGKYR